MTFLHRIATTALLSIVFSAAVTTATDTTTTTTTTTTTNTVINAFDVDDDESLLRLMFQDWVTMNNKSYFKDDDDHAKEEYQRRLLIFQSNAKIVSLHNKAYERGETSFVMSLDGPFADMTDDEFLQSPYIMTDTPQNCSATTGHTSSGRVSSVIVGNNNDFDSDTLPKSVDWRTKGVITPIKNQKSCGSCWTFSTTGCLEAHYCIANKKKDCTQWTGLAEQQLVDCAGQYNNNGCAGGLPSQAFEYIHYNGGIDSEDTYKYTAKDGQCVFKSSNVAAKVDSVFNITSKDEDEIVKAVANIGPVSVAYEVASDFRFYSHGVYDSYNATTKKSICHDDSNHVNHAVVVVGYGETSTSKEDENPIPFYIIRNSWGNTFGMEGYFWMIRGKNMCGVSDCASFPIVNSNIPENNDEEKQQEEQQQQQKPLLRKGIASPNDGVDVSSE